jgi:plastocyanin
MRRDSMVRTRSRRLVVGAVLAAVALVAAGCGGGSGDGGGATRQVLVDYSSDEFASFALYNFPEKVTVRQGDTVEFKQTWTGEPHTVTGGTIVDETLAGGQAWLDFFFGFEDLAAAGVDLPNPEEPGDATVGDLAKALESAEDEELRDQVQEAYAELVAEYDLPPLDESSTTPFGDLVEIVDAKSEEYFSSVPSAFTDDDQLAQNVSQPCYLDEGAPPEDPKEPCTEDDQEQPPFTGRQSYYNSGVIPYEGERSNTFAVDIADDAEVGTYLFYCAIHGIAQKSQVEIVAADAEIPDQSAVNRQIREETKRLTDDLASIYEDAEDGEIEVRGTTVEGPFAGLPGADHTAVNEFLPRNRTVKAGEPITWKMMGADHTISFDVPKYFPIMEFLDDGTVRINPKLEPAAGGAVPYEEPEEPTEEPPKHDGGSWDGSGFWSSGLVSAEPYLEYSMTITKPGTYSYACLLHPPMVGTIKVT